MILALAIVGWLLSTAVLGWSLVKLNQRLHEARTAASVPVVQFVIDDYGRPQRLNSAKPLQLVGNADPTGWDNVCGPPLRLVDDA